MTDTEQQLRRILEEHAADSVHLLDVLLDDLDEESEQRLARAESAERSLSALREAVGPFVPWLRKLLKRDVLDEWCMNLTEEAGPTYGQARALLAAHAGAAAVHTEQTPACAACPERADFETLCCGNPPAAPTLTLEEVEAVLRYQFPSFGISVTRVLETLQERLAQKGAGRG